MEGYTTVRELIHQLVDMPPDAHVQIAVVKYPEEFAIRQDETSESGASWLNGTDTECHILEADEITLQNGIVTIAVELEDYDAQRHFAGG